MSELLATPLSYFQKVAELGSFTAAARALHVSQPSLSVAIRKLEDAIGAPLMHRGRRGVSLTRAGEILLEHARQARRSLDAAADEIRALETEPAGRFTIGSHESLAAYLLPGFLARFLQRFPRVQVSLWNGNSRDVEAAVVERRIDLGLVVNPTRHPDSVVTELFADRVGFVASAALERKQKGRELVLRYPLVHVPVLKQTQYLLGALATLGVAPPQQLTCSSMELVKSLVLDGVGVGLLPYRVAAHGVAAGRLVRLGDGLPSFDDTITLVRRYDLPATAGARALIDALCEHARAMTPLAELLRAPPSRARATKR